MTTKMNEAWNQVFQTLHLLDTIETKGYVEITATTLKEVGRREPRLLAKQDTIQSRPDIFKKHHLSILPIKNGEYVIYRDSEIKSYFQYKNIFDEVPWEFYDPSPESDTIETLKIGSISSEFQAIDYANIASLLKTFTNESQLHLTIRGRLHSGNFSLHLPESDHQIVVDGVQIEVDSGYEGQNGIYLIEAKIGKRDDFHIRQLYYPWKEWSEKANKPIIPIFFVYSNGIFYLSKFKFGERFGDLEITELRSFSINEDPKLDVNLEDLLSSVPVDAFEPESIPFPQANDVDKIIDIITLYGEDLRTKDQISEFFEFDERQGDYYANAAVYLDFLQRDPNNTSSFLLTDYGKEIKRCSNRRCRNRLFIIQLLKRPSFRSAIQLLSESGFNPKYLDLADLARIIKENNPRYNLVTSKRRASTVKGWMKWISVNVCFI